MSEWLTLFLGHAPPAPVAGEPMSDERAFEVALLEAFRGYGRTSPNPSVGCVILDSENRFLASGFHARAGFPHAEISALASLQQRDLSRSSDGWDLSGLPGERLRGARVFVTLEPCAHEGRTPSCARTLARLPIAEVKALLRDPNPLVGGKGFEILRQAGIRASCLEDDSISDDRLTEAARAVCETFLCNMRRERPFISLKVATSLDGIMALKSGESRWITGESSRLFSRFLRGAHDACLVGKNTILKDDPRLDARDTVFAGESRRIVVLDSKGEVLSRPELQIFATHAPENIIVCVGPESQKFSSSQTQVLRLASTTYSDFLKEATAKLWEREIRSLWIEGGALTLSTALAAGLGDRLWLFQGPHLLGASHGRPWTEAWGVSQMSERKSLAGVRHLTIDRDHLTTGRVETLEK